MKKAFTLTELLVIVAIITILAAVLFPVFTASQPKSVPECLHNLRRLIAGAQEYSEDFDDHVLPYLACKNSTQCPGAPSLDVQRVWPYRLVGYVRTPVDPTTGAPYYPATGPYRCPDWTVANLLKGADQADCDGAGGLDPFLPPSNDAQGRSELFSTYGASFGMCSPTESLAGATYCVANGGTVPGTYDYGRDGTTQANAVFAYPGDALYPQYNRRTGRLTSDIWRPAETAFFGDGGSWAFGRQILTVMGCESRYIHVKDGVSGGNYAMMDGHAMFIAGNSESYRYIGPDGLWIEKYFTFYE